MYNFQVYILDLHRNFIFLASKEKQLFINNKLKYIEKEKVILYNN